MVRIATATGSFLVSLPAAVTDVVLAEKVKTLPAAPAEHTSATDPSTALVPASAPAVSLPPWTASLLRARLPCDGVPRRVASIHLTNALVLAKLDELVGIAPKKSSKTDLCEAIRPVAARDRGSRAPRRAALPLASDRIVHFPTDSMARTAPGPSLSRGVGEHRSSAPEASDFEVDTAIDFLKNLFWSGAPTDSANMLRSPTIAMTTLDPADIALLASVTVKLIEDAHIAEAVNTACLLRQHE
jgi:hypothetical protein